MLLMKCIESLRTYNADEVEICIHESGTKQYLNNLPKDIKYRFDKYDGIMHRGWSLNRGVRLLSTNDRLVLMDADILISKNWWDSIENVDIPCVAWNEMLYISKESTKELINGNNKDIKIEKIKTPSMMGAAGGVFYCPKDIFYRVKGIPEDFKGTWGGPDNSFLIKLKIYGYSFSYINAVVFHLWHEKNIPRISEKQLIIWDMLLLSKKDWDNILKEIGDMWGYENAEYIDFMKYKSNIKWTQKMKTEALRRNNDQNI